MDSALENLYFKWLCAKVFYMQHYATTPSLLYWKLFRELHSTEFVWLILGDDNRAADGIELREEFLIEADIPDDPAWRAIGCSVFEMMIAFARRAEFQTGMPAKEWFWEFLGNLGLSEYNDANFSSTQIATILENLVWRLYGPKGEGSMFPLRELPGEQNDNEIWYQFCDYLRDRHRMP